jgi:hypothetical protein
MKEKDVLDKIHGDKDNERKNRHNIYRQGRFCDSL